MEKIWKPDDRNISKDDFRLGQISLYINLLCEARRQHHCAHSLHRAHRTLGSYDQHKLVSVPALFTRLTYRARKGVTLLLDSSPVFAPSASISVPGPFSLDSDESKAL